MYQDKADLLRGCERISEFPRDSFLSCYVFKFDPTRNLDKLILAANVEDANLGSMSVRMNKLLCKWLKIKKYFDVPNGWGFVALIFLDVRGWAPDHCGLSVSTHNFNSVYKVQYVSRDPHGYSGRTGLFFHTKEFTCATLYLSRQLPFAFVKSRSFNKELLTTELITCNIPFKLVPTSDPEIQLLIVSGILHSDKDCARLLREYLKRPNNPAWRLYQKIRVHIDMTYGLWRFQNFCMEKDYAQFDSSDLHRNRSDLVNLVVSENVPSKYLYSPNL